MRTSRKPGRPNQSVTSATRRDCPICRSSSKRTVFAQRFEHLGEVGLLDGYDVVICNSCGAAYADGIPTQAALNAYYRDLSKYEYQHRQGRESGDDEQRLRDTARVIAELVPYRNSQIYEIGCANGSLLEKLKQMGYRNVCGLDPSPSCAAIAKRLYGINVHTGAIFDPSAPPASCDLVIALAVLEHIRDLDSALRKVRNLLSPSGQAFFEVPDAVHPPVDLDAPFQEFSTEHINYFSAISLANLVEAAGFRKITCEYGTRQTRPGVSCPVVYGLFEKAEPRAEFVFDDDTARGLLEYIRNCEQRDEQLRQKIAPALAGERVLVWGVGTHTRRLLANGVLKIEKIDAFVDSNPKYQGQSLRGRPVIAPEMVKNYPAPILISSYAFQREIARQVREDLKLANRLILLYPDREESKVGPNV
ncbi:MAG: methyltransferase domain-containing protein [Terriglobales bacterium]